MSGTREGGKKAAITNMIRHGKDFYSSIGRKGGESGHTGGFASMPREKVQAAGRLGGHNSSRAGVLNGMGKRRKVA